MTRRSTQQRRGAAAVPASASLPTTRGALLAILGFAVLSRVLYLVAWATDPTSRYLLQDARRYDEWARALASGAGFEPGAFYQAPLYPYVVSLVYRAAGPDPIVVYALQALLGVLTVLLVYRAARRAYGSTPALVAAGATALFGPLLFYETKLLPATLAVFLAALVVDQLQAADAAAGDARWLPAGIVLGVAAINGASFLLAAPLALVWLVLDGSRPPSCRARRAAWLFLGIGVVLLPVVVHNRAASGEWVAVSTNGGITFYQGNNPNALGVFSTPPGMGASIFKQRESSRRLAEQQTGRAMGDGEVSAWYFRRGAAFLAEDPWRTLRLLARKLTLALASDEQPLEYNVRLDRNPFRWLTPLPFAALLALAVLRPFRDFRAARPGRAEFAILLPIVVVLATLVVFYVSGRYRLPAIPGLATLAGAGGAVLLHEHRDRPRRSAAMAALALLVASLSLAWMPLVRGNLREQQNAMGWLDRAKALRAVGHGKEAIEAMRRSLALDPVFAGRYLYLARLLDEVGDLEAAMAAVREALHLDPDSGEARFALGVLAVRTGRLDEAADLFGELLRRNPTHAGVANNLLGVLIELGRTHEAREVREAMGRRGLKVDPGLDARLGSAPSLRP